MAHMSKIFTNKQGLTIKIDAVQGPQRGMQITIVEPKGGVKPTATKPVEKETKAK